MLHADDKNNRAVKIYWLKNISVSKMLGAKIMYYHTEFSDKLLYVKSTGVCKQFVHQVWI